MGSPIYADPPRVVGFAHVTCWLCHGFGTVTCDTRSGERDERCAVCAGKCTIVVERESEVA